MDDITDHEIDTVLENEVERFNPEWKHRTYSAAEMRQAFRAGWGNRVGVGL